MNTAWQRAFPRAVVTAFLCGLCLHVGRCSGEKSAGPPIEIVRVDTVAAAQYREMWKRAEARNLGLVAMLEGVKQLAPQTRTVYDTIIKEITVPVAEQVVISGGRAEAVILQPDSGGFQPVRDSYRIGNCDDRLEFIRGKFICDPARLGHLTLFARVGVSVGTNVPSLGTLAQAGLHWQPHYKSTFAAELYGDGHGRATLTFRTGWRPF